MTTMRPELDALPARMQRLAIDARGYVVPWFVQWVDAQQTPVDAGTPGAVPEFRLMDQQKWVRAVRDRRCWVCGDLLGVHLTFVLGPMCAVNRTTSEPPCHTECARWSARNCPFLTRPHMERRDNDGLAARTIANVAGEMITRNPGVTLLVEGKEDIKVKVKKAKGDDATEDDAGDRVEFGEELRPGVHAE